MAMWCAPLVASVGVCTLLGLYFFLRGCVACALVKLPARLRLKRTHDLSASVASLSLPTSSPKLQAVVRKPLRWFEVTCQLSAGHAPAGKVVRMLQSANGQAQSSAVLGLIGKLPLCSLLTAILPRLVHMVRRAKLGQHLCTLHACFH